MHVENSPQQAPDAKSPKLPDYVTNPDAVLGDIESQWRFGKPPDYSNTRNVWKQSKRQSHLPSSLEQTVENLIKNWEIEASFKTRFADWRTVDQANYSFDLNNSQHTSGEEMARVGTYNALLSPSDFYDPGNNSFASSHKTFKRMMPTFAWEVVEVYAGPPKVAFRWRHWGVMQNDYIGINDKNEQVTAKAHGGPIEVQGVATATVDDQLRLQDVHIWYDPMSMFRQIAPNGVAHKTHAASSESDSGGTTERAHTPDEFVMNPVACPFAGTVQPQQAETGNGANARQVKVQKAEEQAVTHEGGSKVGETADSLLTGKATMSEVNSNQPNVSKHAADDIPEIDDSSFSPEDPATPATGEAIAIPGQSEKGKAGLEELNTMRGFEKEGYLNAE